MTQPLVDLRSDTLTQPTPAMREAMYEAVVGDDGYGEDPTVAKLESLFANLVGKEAAIFVPSGVMANQMAMRVHTRPGDVVISGRTQHVVGFEMGASAANASDAASAAWLRRVVTGYGLDTVAATSGCCAAALASAARCSAK